MEQADELQKKWVKIYPSYLDKDLKCAEGRKISSEVAVSNPTTKEIFGACSEILKLNCKEEKVLFKLLETSSQRLYETRSCSCRT